MFLSRSLLATSVLLVSVAAASVGCKDQPTPTGVPVDQKPSGEQSGAAKRAGQLSEAECKRLTEHVMDLLVNEALQAMGGPEGVDKEAANRLRKDMKNDVALKKKAMDCEKTYSREDYNCIMKARSSVAFDICEHK